MNDRLTVLFGGLLALVVVFILFGPKADMRAPVSTPVSSDRGRAGLYALDQFLSRQGINTLGSRSRYDQLFSDGNLPAAVGNLLIISLPGTLAAEDTEIEKLHSWLAEGNTLLVLGAINDSPVWAMRDPTADFAAEVETYTNALPMIIRTEKDWAEQPFESCSNPDAESVLQESAFADGDTEDPPENLAEEFLEELEDNEDWLTPENSAGLARLTNPMAAPYFTTNVVPAIRHPLLASIQEMHVYSDLYTDFWLLQGNEGAHYVRLANDTELEYPALWESGLGAGRIIVSAYSSILSNDAIDQADNIQLAINIANLYVADEGTVIFDDMHQGLTDLYDPEAFFTDPRLHRSIYFAIIFWLLYLLGTSNRLGGAAVTSDAMQESDFRVTLARFMQRRSNPAEAGLLMINQLFRALGRKNGIDETEESIWDALRNSPVVKTAAIDELERSYRALQRGEKVNLSQLHNQIYQIKRAYQ
jgi:hypothetical protein